MNKQVGKRRKLGVKRLLSPITNPVLTSTPAKGKLFILPLNMKLK